MGMGVGRYLMGVWFIGRGLFFLVFYLVFSRRLLIFFGICLEEVYLSFV